MAIQYKADVLALLKAAGYPSTRIRAEKLLGQSYVQQLRKGELISWAALNTVCRLLDCQPGDLLEYVADEIPNAETSRNWTTAAVSISQAQQKNFSKRFSANLMKLPGNDDFLSLNRSALYFGA